MNNHLTLRSGNPTLNAKTFGGFDLTTGATMTIMGTVHKTALALLLLMSTALFTWNLPYGDPKTSALMIIGMIGGFIVALITAFKPHVAQYLSLIHI